MSKAKALWDQTREELPLIAILRGITPDEALSAASVLQKAGYKCLEVPLNSPEAFRTIELISSEFGDELLVGAGTVLTAEDVNHCVDAGGRLIVAPNLDALVARQSVTAGCIYCPGVATPSEAFNALKLGAGALKLFPAELITPAVLKAMRAVLPTDSIVFPVGGISPVNMSAYYKAGANGFGLGSGLYKPGKSIEALEIDALKYVSAWRACEN